MRVIATTGKPHLRLWFGVWSCVQFDRCCAVVALGHGHSWREAWEDFCLDARRRALA